MIPQVAARPSSRFDRAALALVVIACAFFAIRGWHEALRPQGSDFTIYRDAARAVVDGGSPAGVEGYIYPPLLAVLMVPLALLPLGLSAAVWQALSLALLLLAARSCARFVVGGRPPPRLLWAPLACVLRLADSGFANGQADFVTLFLIVAALADVRRGREGRAGAWVGLAAAIKVLPGALLVWFLVRRRWRALVGGGGMLAAAGLGLPAIALGPARFADELGIWMRNQPLAYLQGGAHLATAREYLHGQSLLPSAFRVLTRMPATSAGARANVFDLPVETAYWIVIALLALHVLAAVTAAGRHAWRPGERAWLREAGLVVCLPLICAPLVHKAHMVWLLVPMTVLLSARGADLARGAAHLRLALVVFAILSIAFTTPALLGRASATGLLAHNTIFFGLEAVFGALLVGAWTAPATGLDRSQTPLAATAP